MAPIGRPAVGPLSRRHPGRPRSGAARHRHGVTGDAAGGPPPGIANIVWRTVICGIGFGFFQTPNSAGTDVERAAASQRQRQQHRRHRAPDRTDPRRRAWRRLCFGLAGHDGATLCTGTRRGVCCARQRDEFLAVGRGCSIVNDVIAWRRSGRRDGFGGRVATSQYAGRRVSCCFRPPFQAQTVWDMPTEYPQNAMPGVGLTPSPRHAAESSAGKLEIRPSFDAKAGIKSAGTLAAIAEGRAQSRRRLRRCAQGAEDLIFALPSLPFLVTSTSRRETPSRYCAGRILWRRCRRKACGCFI